MKNVKRRMFMDASAMVFSRNTPAPDFWQDLSRNRAAGLIIAKPCKSKRVRAWWNGRPALGIRGAGSQPEFHPQLHQQGVLPGAHVVVGGHDLFHRGINLLLLLSIGEFIRQPQG